MKNIFKLIGTQSRRLFGPLCAIALLAVIAFTFAACDDGSGGGDGPETLTYKGTSGATTFTLKITKTAARSFVPTFGDSYVLTANTDKSEGKVATFGDGNFTLQPSNEGAPTFGATVTDEGLTSLTGTITVTDGTTRNGPGALTPSGGPGPVSPPQGGGNMTWTAVADSPFGTSRINVIAYGNNKFVAGGDDGKMAYSTDGVTWTAVADSTFGTTIIRGIAYGNNKFVAVGTDGKMAYSSDGVTWTAVTDNTIWIVGYSNDICIAYGNNKFVAGGSEGRTAYSSDGVNWTPVDSTLWEYKKYSLTMKADIEAITYGNNKFVAGGTDGKMAYSADGINWTAIAITVPTGKVVLGIDVIYWGGNKFVLSANSYDAYSPDGITWTILPHRININTWAIAWGNNKFVAAGGALISYSADGVEWETDYEFGFHVFATAFGNGTFVAGGSAGKMAYSTGN